jgi:phosphoglycerol geranylgeranyltransferase
MLRTQASSFLGLARSRQFDQNHKKHNEREGSTFGGLEMPGKVWSYITEKLEKEGACHFSLLDPDPLKNSTETMVQMATLAEKAGSDAIMLGGSTVLGNVDEAVKAISDAAEIPTILFPGNLNGVSGNADAMFFMSLLNSTNPYWIIGAQALSAANVKMLGIETIPMAYLLIAPGKTAAWVGDAKVFPRDKPKIPLMYALAAELLGFKLVYLEAGSGAEGGGVPPEMIKTVCQYVSIPVIAGGGFNDEASVVKGVEAGASIIVQGTYIEDHILKDKGDGLRKIVKALKVAGSKRV